MASADGKLVEQEQITKGHISLRSCEGLVNDLQMGTDTLYVPSVAFLDGTRRAASYPVLGQLPGGYTGVSHTCKPSGDICDNLT